MAYWLIGTSSMGWKCGMATVIVCTFAGGGTWKMISDVIAETAREKQFTQLCLAVKGYSLR